MQITFSWESTLGVISPHCVSDTVNKDGISLLSCLLMDNGGIAYPQAIPWIEEGIKKANSALSHEIVSSRWDRESWGAIITIDGVKVYSLHDDEYFEDIPLQKFKSALVSWKSFMESKPKLGEMRVVSL